MVHVLPPSEDVHGADSLRSVLAGGYVRNSGQFDRSGQHFSLVRNSGIVFLPFPTPSQSFPLTTSFAGLVDLFGFTASTFIDPCFIGQSGRPSQHVRRSLTGSSM